MKNGLSKNKDFMLIKVENDDGIPLEIQLMNTIKWNCTLEVWGKNNLWMENKDKTRVKENMI